MDRDSYYTRLSVVQAIRCYFNKAGFLEVETPLLSRALVPEPNISGFKTSYNGMDKDELYLLPSPEYYMKQLLAAGWGDMFQISKSFRNEEGNRLHSPEFTMLEYYWVDHNYIESMALTEDLISYLSRLFMGKTPHFNRISMQEAFKRYMNINLAELCGAGNQATEADNARLKKVANTLGVFIQPDDDWETLFNRLFLNFVEPEISSTKRTDPVFIYDYPAKLQTLSQNVLPWTERWELYWKGVELANCFSEENSKTEIQQYVQWGLTNDALGGDPDYARKIDGMPPCSGTALGLDRLVMLLTGAGSIGKDLPFSI